MGYGYLTENAVLNLYVVYLKLFVCVIRREKIIMVLYIRVRSYSSSIVDYRGEAPSHLVYISTVVYQ